MVTHCGIPLPDMVLLPVSWMLTNDPGSRLHSSLQGATYTGTPKFYFRSKYISNLSLLTCWGQKIPTPKGEIWIFVGRFSAEFKTLARNARIWPTGGTEFITLEMSAPLKM